MSRPFGASAPGGPPYRPACSRNSYHRGEREGLIWRPLGGTRAEARRFKGAVRKAAQRFDHSTKTPETRMGGVLRLTGLAVLNALLDIVDDVTGRLEPSIATIADRAKLGVRTVVRALRRLSDAGFLDWLRRTEAVEQEGAGPQVQQITNAYWFALRGRAAGMVRLILSGRAPPEARSREEVQTVVTAARNERLKEMRSPLGRVSASDVLSDEVKASLRKLSEKRSASAATAKNPGDRG
jgi:hypothetical protein